MHNLTMQDIEAYLATKGDDEVIGVCLDGNACLAHNTLTWKYGLENDAVIALCSHAYVNRGGLLDFPQDVERAVDTFDHLKAFSSPVTKAEFVAALAQRLGGEDGK